MTTEEAAVGGNQTRDTETHHGTTTRKGQWPNNVRRCANFVHSWCSAHCQFSSLVGAVSRVSAWSPEMEAARHPRWCRSAGATEAPCLDHHSGSAASPKVWSSDQQLIKSASPQSPETSTLNRRPHTMSSQHEPHRPDTTQPPWKWTDEWTDCGVHRAGRGRFTVVRMDKDMQIDCYDNFINSKECHNATVTYFCPPLYTQRNSIRL